MYINKKFAIIIDEAHSSQNGSLAAKMNIAVSGNVYDDDDEFEDKLNTIIEGKKMAPNASYFAFTATPKNKTLEMFGKKMFDEHGKLEKAYEFMKQFVLGGINLLEKFLEWIGEKVKDVKKEKR